MGDVIRVYSVRPASGNGHRRRRHCLQQSLYLSTGTSHKNQKLEEIDEAEWVFKLLIGNALPREFSDRAGEIVSASTIFSDGVRHHFSHLLGRHQVNVLLIVAVNDESQSNLRLAAIQDSRNPKRIIYAADHTRPHKYAKVVSPTSGSVHKAIPRQFPTPGPRHKPSPGHSGVPRAIVVQI